MARGWWSVCGSTLGSSSGVAMCKCGGDEHVRTRIYAMDEAPARSGREARWKAGAPDGSDAEDQGTTGCTETSTR